ncbi:MAG: MaoC family dehydratase, partial [Alphaproteobacteria bacterium]
MSHNKDDIKADMLTKVGTEVGVTDWVLVDQKRIQDFADATLDQQWIHTNPEMAAKGPFGGPIAHGLLTLSLLPHFGEQVAWIPRPKMSVNYGYNK